MPISLYAASIPTLIHTLKALRVVLSKADAHAQATKVDGSVFLQGRLYPNMFPLVRQVQIACDFAKGAGGRLAGIELPKFEDNEATFADLHGRIEKTIEFLETIKPEQINGQEARAIEIKAGSRTFNFTGQDYLLTFVNPNFYFHVVTTYAILRHFGVEVGKGDYLGAP